MINIKGFVSIDGFANNTDNTISALGELSPWSRTYSRHQGDYSSPQYPSFNLTTFRTIDTATLAPVIISSDPVDLIFKITQSAIDYARSRIRPFDLIDFQNSLLVTLNGLVSNFTIGDFADNGVTALPQWISFNTTIAGIDYEIKFWLSDSAFRDQYEHYEIEVIGPISPMTEIDFFFSEYNVVLQRLSSLSTVDLGNLVQEAKKNNPETFLRFLNFDFYNRINPLQKTPTTWAVLVYGRAGDNIDAIKSAIIDAILSNSNSPRAIWETILPGLFKTTEFFLLPRWDKISIPNLTANSALYSVIQNLTESLNFTKAALPGVPALFIDENLSIFPYDYKEIAVLALPGQGNIPGFFALSNLYPDYMALSSTSLDFSRMSLKTQGWVLFLQELLLAAETLTPTSGVSGRVRAQTKDNVLYASSVYDNVNYLVAAKSNPFYLL